MDIGASPKTTTTVKLNKKKKRNAPIVQKQTHVPPPEVRDLEGGSSKLSLQGTTLPKTLGNQPNLKAPREEKDLGKDQKRNHCAKPSIGWVCFQTPSEACVSPTMVSQNVEKKKKKQK